MIAATIREVEDRYRVPHAKEPDGKFATDDRRLGRGASRSAPSSTSPTSRSARPRRATSCETPSRWPTCASSSRD